MKYPLSTLCVLFWCNNQQMAACSIGKDANCPQINIAKLYLQPSTWGWCEFLIPVLLELMLQFWLWINVAILTSTHTQTHIICCGVIVKQVETDEWQKAAAFAWVLDWVFQPQNTEMWTWAHSPSEVKHQDAFGFLFLLIEHWRAFKNMPNLHVFLFQAENGCRHVLPAGLEPLHQLTWMQQPNW